MSPLDLIGWIESGGASPGPVRVAAKTAKAVLTVDELRVTCGTTGDAAVFLSGRPELKFFEV
jgi:hypothetical protein